MTLFSILKVFSRRRAVFIFAGAALFCLLAVWAEQRGYLREHNGRDFFESLRRRWERSAASQSLKHHFNTKREGGAAATDRIQGTPEADFLRIDEEADIVSQVTDGESLAKAGKPFCVFYDRPPRTGSTTVSHVLHSCFAEKNGYNILPRWERKSRHRYIPEMMKSPGPWTAVVKYHLYLAANSEQLLKQSCSNVFYISSTRSMRNRLLSAIKYKIVAKGGSANGTAEFERVEDRVRSWANKRKNGFSASLKTESLLEDYPYIHPGDDASLLVPEENRMTPDYVIRSTNFDEDLSKLLSTLGCRENFTSTNIHKSKGTESDADETRLLNMLNLEYDDNRWKTLRQLGKLGNEAGLVKAAMLAKIFNAG